MAAVEDCYTVLRWLYRDSAAIGINPQRIAVLGDSAGGGIAAGLVLLARDRGEVPIACQVLTYPMLDDRTGSTVDPGEYSGEFGWSRAANRFAWQARLGHPPGSRPLSPYLSPAHATELAGLPPTFIGVGALDLFAPESMAYAQLLISSGVPTELHVYPGAVHGFDWVRDAAVSLQFARDRMAAVRRLLASQAAEKRRRGRQDKAKTAEEAEFRCSK